MTWREPYTTVDHSRRLSLHRHLSLQVQLAPPAQLQALLIVSNDVAVVLVEVEVHRPATTAADSLDSSDY